MTSVIVEIDLCQSSAFTSSPIRIESKTTRSLGCFVPRLDVNESMTINRPLNNIFSVKLIDNATKKVSLEDYEYVIQIHFVKEV
jgi:hypothetical protein